MRESSEWVFIIPIANNVTHVSGIKMERNAINFFYFLSLWQVSKAETVMTDKFQESARFFCRIADLRKQETPTNISLRTAVNQPQFKVSRHNVLSALCHIAVEIFWGYKSAIYRTKVTFPVYCKSPQLSVSHR